VVFRYILCAYAFLLWLVFRVKGAVLRGFGVCAGWCGFARAGAATGKGIGLLQDFYEYPDNESHHANN